jgi:hypothetical protein
MERSFTVRGIPTVLLVTTVTGTVPIYADLDDFAESVEEEQEKGPDERKKPSSEIPEHPDEDVEDEGFQAFLAGLEIFMAWGIHNGSRYYPDYPYSYDRNAPVAVGSEESEHVKPEDLNFSRFTLQTFVSLSVEGDEFGWATGFRFYGLMRLLGPDLEYRRWTDRSGSIDYLHIGWIVPLFQTNPATLELTVGGASYYGLFRLNGLTFFGTLRSYPFRPISLEVRGGGVYAPELILGVCGARIGVHIDMFEIGLDYYGLFHRDHTIHSAGVGAAIHF